MFPLPSWSSQGKKRLRKRKYRGTARGGAAVVARIRCKGCGHWKARWCLPFSTSLAVPRHTVRPLRLVWSIPIFSGIDNIYQASVKQTGTIPGQYLPACVWSSNSMTLPGSQERVWFTVEPLTIFWFFQYLFLLASWSYEKLKKKKNRKKEGKFISDT